MKIPKYVTVEEVKRVCKGEDLPKKSGIKALSVMKGDKPLRVPIFLRHFS